MKLQENKRKIFNLQKQALNNGYNFKEKIPNYINEINLSTFLLDQSESKLQPLHISKKLHFETQKNLLRSQHSSVLQTSTKFILFLGRSTMENYSEIIVYEYMKASGKFVSLEMNGIKGQISCLKAKFCQKRKQTNTKKIQTLKNTKKSASSKNTQQTPYEIVLLIGTVQGYLKTLRFSQISQQNNEPTFIIESLKLDFCQIVDLNILDSSYYNGANVSLVLSVTNRVYLVNFDTMSLLAYFLPTIMGCQVGLGLSVNYEQQYFIQTCEGGYIIFWDLNDRVLNLIATSSNQTKTEQEQFMVQEKKQNHPQLITQTFKSADIYHCISPLNIFHCATISGLKYCQLYGNLLLIITQGGLLKLLAINKSSFTHLCQNEYTSLLEYQIQDGELITDVKFFPQNMEVFVVKSCVLDGFVNKSGFQKFMPVKEYQINRQVSKKKNKSETTKVYKPLRLKTFQNNILPERQRSKSSDNRQGKCYFERIIFNSELEIEKVDKIYPSQYIDCIECLQMTESRDIIVLRGREFYLIGTTELFREINIA